jgi:2,3-bisphosphoglycerate-independent phosphoglycerate mutase
MNKTKKAMLIILDGWGVTQDKSVSAIAQAKTPFFDSLLANYPNSEVLTDGLNVGLPDGQMGNSEVGHMNLGAGRVVYQDLVKINKAIAANTFEKEIVIQDALAYAKKNHKPIHFLGLTSDGGVHAHIEHLKALITIADKAGVPSFIHVFTDGRDVDPNSAIDFIKDLNDFIKNKNSKIASIIGRYYAMDRDNRWERIKLAYDLLVNGKGTFFNNAQKAIQKSYDNAITDEFIKPILLEKNGNIKVNDVVFFFNYRTDRGRELTTVLSQEDFAEYNMKKLALYYVTMTTYDEKFENIKIVYPKDNLKDTLGEIMQKNNKTQIRIAETEKYAHVTFFFSGGREKPFDGEKRILIPSPKVATYDLKPEMSAPEVRDAIVPELKKGETDLVILNFANTDMVGHTGVFEAAIKAAEAVDFCLKDVVTAAKNSAYNVIILADHGNSEKMQNKDGSANTAHTTNPVPMILVSNNKTLQIKNGKLANIAPSLLDLMEIAKPVVMQEASLIIK